MNISTADECPLPAHVQAHLGSLPTSIHPDPSEAGFNKGVLKREKLRDEYGKPFTTA